MSGAEDRFPIFPTRMALTSMKIRLKGAVQGHSLLKKKSDALTMRFREVVKLIVDDKKSTVNLLRDAAFSLAAATVTAGEISQTVIENVSEASIKLRLGTENAMGVRLPIFEAQIQQSNEQELTGLARGGQRIREAKDTYTLALKGLIRLASLQTSFSTLDLAIKQTNRRVNALEYVIQPKIRNTLAYIESELDEQDREEFYRLKKVQDKKKIVMARKEQDRALRAEAAQKLAEENKSAHAKVAAARKALGDSNVLNSSGANMANTADADEDIVF